MPDQFEKLLPLDHASVFLDGSFGIKRQLVSKRVSENVSPSELHDIVRRKATKELVARCELSDNQRFAVFAEIQKPENLYELEVIEMDDLPSILLKDGDCYKDSASLLHRAARKGNSLQRRPV